MMTRSELDRRRRQMQQRIQEVLTQRRLEAPVLARPGTEPTGPQPGSPD